MRKKFSAGLLILVFSASGVFAQSAAQMSFSELIAQAEYATKNNEPQKAIPILKEIISRAGSLDDRAAQSSVQIARLQLGSAFSQIQKWDEARKYTKEYLANEPVKDRPEALQVLCQIALAEKNWKELEASSRGILAENTSIRLAKLGKQFLLQALYNLQKYDETLKMLPEMIETSNEPAEIRAYRIMKVRCLFETGKINDLIAELPALFRGEAREDITLNLMLLRMGDQLFDKQEYRTALLMYRLVTPRADLLARQQERLTAAEQGSGEGAAAEGAKLKKALEELKNVPEYDVHISYRAAQIYSEQKRYWEAVVLFDQLYRKYPQNEQGQASALQKILLLYEIGAEDEAIKESRAFLEKHRGGLYPRMVCARLAQHYLNKKELEKALKLDPQFAANWAAPAGADEIAQDTDLRYMFSFARFQLGDYEEAFNSFDRIIRTAPGTQAAIDSNYWKAMCRLLQQKYQLAYEQFMQYRKTWPRASFAPAALFRAGVCRFGLEDYEGAKSAFKTFIDDYPDDVQMPEALSMYGDLLAADGLIDEALASYQRAIQIVQTNYNGTTDPILKAQMVIPATYAVLQGVQALKADAEAHVSQDEPALAEGKYRQIIAWMEQYMKGFGDNADWAQGVFWIGKAQIELGEPEKAVKAYLDTVIQHGADPAKDGVAFILYDLAGIIRNRLPRDQFEPTVLSIKKARDIAKSHTVQILLDVLLAELNGTRDELGRTLLAREKNLDEVPPSGLSLMCSAMMDKQDFSRSQELFDFFAEHYENSPFRAGSYQLRGLDLYQQKKFDAAYDLAVEALGKYGATADTGWAQLTKGNVELSRGEYKKAVETFNMIFGVREWRGPVAAEAMFRMAEAWEKQENYEKAFAFFQRTYLLYKTYDGGRWAAEGYLRSAQCLKKMGRTAAARNTYRAMLLDSYVRDLPQAQEAKTVLGPAETDQLLAGGTNTMETVELEGGK